jgi:hypothetical protein
MIAQDEPLRNTRESSMGERMALMLFSKNRCCALAMQRLQYLRRCCRTSLKLRRRSFYAVVLLGVVCE